jgi:hypothetical protein
MHAEKVYFQKPDDFVPNPTFDDGSLRCPGWSKTKGRQCGNSPMKKKKTCRMHGSKGGRPPNDKYIIGQRMKGFNRLLEHPELTTLINESAANSAMLQRLFDRLENCESAGAGRQIDVLLKKVYAAAASGAAQSVMTTLHEIEELRDEERKEGQINWEIREHFRVSDSFVKTMHKMAMDSKAMIPAVHVLEYMQLFQRILFRVIPNAKDRAWVINEMRSYGPEGL